MTDRELFAQAVVALEYHTQQTRSISNTNLAIEALRARLAQPECEWIGLTDEEIREFEIWLDDEEEKHGWNPPVDIVKYIEQALKEKNHG